MPSRPTVGLIALFWLATSAYIGHREIWPRFFADAPPPIRIDLADEAAQALPVRWTVHRGNQPIGTLTTRMQYVPEDDTFRFVSQYNQLTLEVARFSFDLGGLETSTRVTRTGELREQRMAGKLRVALVTPLSKTSMGEPASAEVTGTVADGRLVGRCRIWYPANAPDPVVDRPLEPVPVTAGQVLNPMAPVGRLRDVRPGQRWVIRQVDPLQDAMAILFKEVLKDSQIAATVIPRQTSQEMLAEVLQSPVQLTRLRVEPVECWVIEYRGEGVQAKTWVSREDGRVLRQEATGFGEQLRFERED